MKLLLDTHIAIWAVFDPEALTGTESQLITDIDTTLVLSAVSVWELRLKWSSFHVSGARKGVVGPSTVLAFAEAMNWQFLPLTPRHAATVLDHPLVHRDPFDELLLVQAQVEGMRLLTRDAKLADHPLAAAATK